VNFFVVNDFSEETQKAVHEHVANGGKYVLLAPECEKSKPPFNLPEDVYVTDQRFGGLNFVRGNHPRLEGLWTQYSHLDTGLARNITFSQTITDSTPIEDWQSQPHTMQDAPTGALDSEQYRHAHNHYQLLHSEVYNFSKDLNGVAIWGDSAALAPNAKSWGAFFSARSWPLKWTGYTPSELFAYDEATQFDAALVGVEIDVLNAGKDFCGPQGIDPEALAKVGLQIVGFGKKNTAAIEIRTEDSDDPARSAQDRRGAWHWGIIMRNALDDKSTVLMSENGHVRRGIDFDRTTFSEGAMRISGLGTGSGVLFDQGSSGEIYSDPNDASLNLRVGNGGLKLWSSDGKKLLCKVTDRGIEFCGNGNGSRFGRALRRLLKPLRGVRNVRHSPAA
jgi:hypothetical protein